jgi:hypothetical protein
VDAKTGRPSIAPEKLLRALLLQVLYSVRSERMLMEQLNYNLLFRWFVVLNMDDAIWDATVFSKNRQRLLGQICVLPIRRVAAVDSSRARFAPAADSGIPPVVPRLCQSSFSRCLRVPIAMHIFYEQSLWICQPFLLTNPEFHHSLLGCHNLGDVPWPLPQRSALRVRGERGLGARDALPSRACLLRGA